MTLAFVLGLISVILNLSILCKWIPKNKFDLSKTQKSVLNGLIIGLLLLLSINLLIWWQGNIRLLGFKVFSWINTIGLIILFFLYPINRLIGNYPNKINFKTLTSSIIYLLFSFGLIAPFGTLLTFSLMNPLLGLERELIYENEKFLFEMECSVISSGGQNDYVLYRKSFIGDLKIKEFVGYPSEVENNRFFEKLIQQK